MTQLDEHLPLAPGVGTPMALSPAQLPIWYAEVLTPGTSRWTIVTAAFLSGPLDLDRLVAAAHSAVRRFASLRTRLNLRGRRAGQTVVDDDPDTVEVRDLPGAPAETRSARRDALLEAEKNRPFDVQSGALHRVVIVRIGPDEHLLILRQHHAIIDAPGIGTVLRHIAEAYTGEARDEASPNRSYEDWLSRRSSPGAMPLFAPALAHATEVLTGANHQHGAIYDRPAASEVPAFYVRDIVRPLGAEQVNALKALRARCGCSLFVVFLAAYVRVLARRLRAGDLTIGVTVSGRAGEPDDIVGMCINMVLLRLGEEVLEEADLSPDAFIHRVAASWAAWSPYQNVPLFWLNQAAPAGIVPTRAQFMINMIDVRRTPFSLPGVRSRVRYITTGYPTGDLVFTPTSLEDDTIDMRLYVGTPRISPQAGDDLLTEIDALLRSWSAQGAGAAVVAQVRNGRM